MYTFVYIIHSVHNGRMIKGCLAKEYHVYTVYVTIMLN
jgi:hypothetical protein